MLPTLSTHNTFNIYITAQFSDARRGRRAERVVGLSPKNPQSATGVRQPEQDLQLDGVSEWLVGSTACPHVPTWVNLSDVLMHVFVQELSMQHPTSVR